MDLSIYNKYGEPIHNYTADITRCGCVPRLVRYYRRFQVNKMMPSNTKVAVTNNMDNPDRQHNGSLHALRILGQLSSLRHLDGLCDCTVRLNDGTVRVSKALLAAGCPYFKALYQFEEGGSQKTQEPHLDLSCATFELIMNFIYKGSVPLDGNNIEDVLRASDLLLMGDLKEICIQYLMDRIDVDNCLGILLFAQQFTCPRLVHFTKNFISQHFRHREIVRTDEFRELSEKRLREILSWDELDVRSEVDILTALVVWLNANLDKKADVELLVTTCLRESSDLNYDPKFQRALQELRAGQALWDSPGAEKVREALTKTPRIRCIRERGKKTVLACCDTQARVYLVDVFSQGKFAGSHYLLPPMCVPRIKPAMIVEGGFLFLLGGLSLDKKEVKKDVQRYDPTTNTWSLLAPMPYAAAMPKVVALNGKLYVTGGFDDEVELEIGQLEMFDIYMNRWSSLPPVPNIRRGAALTSADNKLYYIGGSPWQEPQIGSMSFRVVDAVEIFYIKDETWVAGPQLQERRCNSAAVYHDGNLYVVGGVRPIECPSAKGQLKVTGTECLHYDSSFGNIYGWTKQIDYHVPYEASVCVAALAHPNYLVILGNARPSEVTKTSCFVKYGSSWCTPPGADCILNAGTHVFYGFVLMTLPSACLQDLTSHSDS